MQAHPLPNTLNNWRSQLSRFQRPDTRQAVVQVLNSFLPFFALWGCMYYSLRWSYLITLPLGVITAFFLVRIFIIQHDCGHQSFLRSRWWNNTIGLVSSLFSSIPYKYWSSTHNAHHLHNGQLEHRGLGDIYYMTTEEYGRQPRWKRLVYRLFRTPVFQFVVVPIAYLAVTLRYPFIRLKGWDKIRRSYFLNNLLIAAFYGTLMVLMGWHAFLMVQGTVLLIFGIIAFWFFYVQHQHEENYKEWKDEWDSLQASLRGSTHYKLPRLFQWLSGNIGFHHIHHMNCLIPNYRLEACAVANPQFDPFVSTLTFRQSLGCMRHKLWHQPLRRMVSFKEYAALRREEQRCVA